MKLTTHLHLVSRLRMRGAMPPLFHTSSLCGVIKHRENLVFAYAYFFYIGTVFTESLKE
jgi:hypothetical protein